jgi:hypothetical protein
VKNCDPRQLSFQFGRPPVAVPAKPLAPALTSADRRRILRTAQAMQLNTARPDRELYALGRLEVWMRGMLTTNAGDNTATWECPGM